MSVLSDRLRKPDVTFMNNLPKMEGIILSPEEKLNNSNYELWESKIKSRLILHGLWAYTSGRKVKDSNNSNDWDEKDEMALAAIKCNVSDEKLRHIKDTKTSQEAWNILKKLHQHETQTVSVKTEEMREIKIQGEENRQISKKLNPSSVNHKDRSRTDENASSTFHSKPGTSSDFDNRPGTSNRSLYQSDKKSTSSRLPDRNLSRSNEVHASRRAADYDPNCPDDKIANRQVADEKFRQTTDSSRKHLDEKNASRKTNDSDLCSNEKETGRQATDHSHNYPGERKTSQEATNPRYTSRQATDHYSNYSDKRDASPRSNILLDRGRKWEPEPEETSGVRYQSDKKPTSSRLPDRNHSQSNELHASRRAADYDPNCPDDKIANRQVADEKFRQTTDSSRKHQDQKGNQREYNLIIQGIESIPNETEADSKRLVTTELQNMNLDVEEDDIRLAYRKESNLNPKPMVVTFFSIKKKGYVLSTMKRLKKTHLLLYEDFSEEVMRNRRKLIKYEKYYRDRNYQAQVIYDKLKVGNDLYSWDPISGNLRLEKRKTTTWFDEEPERQSKKLYKQERKDDYTDKRREHRDNFDQ